MKIITAKTPARITEITAELVNGYPHGLDENIYVFVETRATLSFERKIAKKDGGFFGVNVYGFSRYVYLNSKVKKYLSKSASSLLVRSVIGKKRDELKRLKDVDYKFAPAVYELISQLKSAKVTPDDLQSVIDGESGAFGSKLADIKIIYDEYEKYIKGNDLTDESGFLSLMPSLIKNDEKLKGSKVIIAGISSLTRQTVDVITSLDKFCDVTYVLLYGDENCYTNEVFYKLLSLFPTAEVTYDDVYPTKEAKEIEKGLFNPLPTEKFRTDKVKVYELKDPKSEAEFVAKKIRMLVTENGMRYKDFCIAVPDVAAYSSVCKEAFESLNVPFFADVKKPLSAHPAARLFSLVARLKKQRFSPDIFIETAKNPLCSSENGAAVEKYVLHNAVSRKDILKPFCEEEAEKARLVIVKGVNSIPQKATISKFVEAIIDLYADFGTDERVEKLKNELSERHEDYLKDFCETGYGKFFAVLDEASRTGGEEEVSFQEFADIVSAGIEGTEIAVLPQYSDGVFIGDFSSARQRISKGLFVLGATQDVPSSKADLSLLSDRELLKMDGYKCVVEPKIKAVNKREKENVATTLMSFTHFLAVTYPCVDFLGVAVKPGQLIEDLNKIFLTADGKNVLVRKDALKEAGYEKKFTADDFMTKSFGLKKLCAAVSEARDGANDDTSAAAAFAFSLKENDEESYERARRYLFPKEEVVFNDKLSYGNNISATALERYFNCPYAGFVDNRLKLNRPETGDAESYEVGNLIHSVLEDFAPIALSVPEEDIEKVVNELFDREMKESGTDRFLGKPRYVHIFALVREEAQKRCRLVREELLGGDFRVSGAEVSFSDDKNSKYPPLELATPYGLSVLRGKIDRVDEFVDETDGEKKKYVRIVDYKTGSVDKKDSDENLYSGRSIQLYLYMNVLTEAGAKPAGVYYYKIDDSFSQKGEDGSGYTGKGIDNLSVMTRMDKSVTETGESKIFSFRTVVDKDTGEIVVKTGKNIVDESTLSSYVAYAKKVAESGAGEILRGCVIPSPYEGACDVCKYKGMCGYDSETGVRTRKVSANADTIRSCGEKTVITNEEVGDDE